MTSEKLYLTTTIMLEIEQEELFAKEMVEKYFPSLSVSAKICTICIYINQINNSNQLN
jgi:hypothetical protein